ncbi:hypothetical protein O181_001064 [Austropuccinia psidii MF-1]|uniref:Integrase catalytic domain-containing protein n=1 Tax=Austropuccinia psidii MF-1 TaxID=1389203 RepID=A0A9Q3GBH4_9BASI|nr:hypothetical protein [Austropuccinia psidii MF-1]
MEPDDMATSSRIQRQLETKSLGLSLTPHLNGDGSNFHQWSRSLCRLVENIFEIKSYFSSIERDSNHACNRKIWTFIEKSIHPYLRCHADDEDEARRLFGFLRDRFDRLLWSKQYFHDIANALDGKLAIDRNAKIMPKEVLQIADQMMKRLIPLSMAVDTNVTAKSSAPSKPSGGHPPKARPQLNTRRDVVVIDLVGPFPISVQRHLYGLVIQDHSSSVVLFIPLKSKNEATKAALGWLRSLNVLSGHQVKRLRSNNAGEFASNDFEDGLFQLGIMHAKEIPYEHHNNGKVERVNRTLSEASRIIMLEKTVDVALWPWAFRHVAWVFNRTLHTYFVQTPSEIVTGNKLNVSILRVFGCIAYVHDPLHKKDLKAKSRKLIHMGIAQDAKGWIFWCPDRKAFVKSSSAIFDEHGVLNGDWENEAVIKSLNIKKIDDPPMINEISGQDEVFSLIAIDMHMGSGAPLSYSKAIESEQKINWEEEMRAELDSLEEMQVWQEVSSQGVKNVLGSRWVYALKTNEAGKIVCFEARAVVQGHRQIKGINFEETFAPTPTFQSLRGLLAIASAYKWQAATFDVKTAYLNSPLEEDINIKPPPGKILNMASNVLRLKRAVYGLKQAACCWWTHLTGLLGQMGFKPNNGNQSTYSYSIGKDTALLWIHVEYGILVANTLGLMEKLGSQLSVSLALKWDVDLQSIVGIDVKRAGQQQADKEYLPKVGMILYLAQATRPDVMFAINFLARFSMATRKHHWLALRHLISYLEANIEDVLVIEADLGRKATEMFVDANWGSEGLRSQHGYVGLMWNSKCQPCIASSTLQVEYMDLAFGAKNFTWVIDHFGCVLQDCVLTIYSDNMAAIKVAGNESSGKKARHIERELHVINEMVVKGKVIISWVKSFDQLADVFTRNLGANKIERFKSQIGCRPIVVEGSVKNA